ncbi:hypothetical protein TNCV_114611 [Trichonephila clavipes]|nr:hypothetical protein TNCV_114611 [Trichonephila clavipes]
MVRELQHLPPCTDPDCPDQFSALAESVNFNSMKNYQTARNLNPVKLILKRIMSKKRKDCKDNPDDFVFCKKTIRPNSPMKSSEPVITQNTFENLEQDDEPSHNIENNNEKETNVPKRKLPSIIMFKIKNNYR